MEIKIFFKQVDQLDRPQGCPGTHISITRHVQAGVGMVWWYVQGRGVLAATSYFGQISKKNAGSSHELAVFKNIAKMRKQLFVSPKLRDFWPPLTWALYLGMLRAWGAQWVSMVEKHCINVRYTDRIE